MQKEFQVYPKNRDHICIRCGGEIKNGVCTTCNWHTACCCCGKVRDEFGIWIESDVEKNEHDTSSGICPVCLGLNYPNEAKLIAEKRARVNA